MPARLDRSEAMIRLAMADLMTRRLAGKNTPRTARHLNSGSDGIEPPPIRRSYPSSDVRPVPRPGRARAA